MYILFKELCIFFHLKIFVLADEFGIPILSELGLSEHRKETSLMLEYIHLKDSIKGAFEGLGVGFTRGVQPKILAGPIDIGKDVMYSQLGTSKYRVGMKIRGSIKDTTKNFLAFLS